MQEDIYSKDEINLKELFNILRIQKKKIIIITISITILTGIYEFYKSPTYKATALIKTGNYQNIPFQSVHELLNELNFLFVYNKNKTPYVSSIINKNFKVKTMFEITSEAPSKELAVDNINQIVRYIQSNNVNSFNKILSTKNKEISNIDKLIQSKDFKGDYNELIDKKLLLMKIDKNSLAVAKVLGEIVIRKNPTESKKIRTIIMALIAGFLLSIFLILIANTFKSKE